MQTFLALFRKVHYTALTLLVIAILLTPGANLWAGFCLTFWLGVEVINWVDNLKIAAESKERAQRHVATAKKKFFYPVLANVVWWPLALGITYMCFQSSEQDITWGLLFYFPIWVTILVAICFLVGTWVILYEFSKKASKWPGADT